MKVFVFGANTRGLHGAGAARDAVRFHGAIMGVGEGLQGNSYAIPTKDEDLRTLPLSSIKGHVQRFLEFAKAHPKLEFGVTRIGCGLAGYADADIGQMFKGAPANVTFFHYDEFENWEKYR